MSDAQFDWVKHAELAKRRSAVRALMRTAPSIDCSMLNRIKELELLRQIAIHDQVEEWRQRAKDKPRLDFALFASMMPLASLKSEGAAIDFDQSVTHKTINLPPDPELRSLVLLVEAEKFLIQKWEHESGVKHQT